MRGIFLILFTVLFVQQSFALAFRKNDRVVFYGDSNTEHGTYPKLIEKFYTKKFPELKLEFFNAGQSGDCISAGYYTRYQQEVLSLKPDVLFVMFGINDLNWGRNISEHDFDIFLTHARLTVQRALEAGVRDVYILSYPITDYALEGSDPELCSQIPTVSEGEDSPLQRLGDEAIKISTETCVNGNCGKGLDIERTMRQGLVIARKNNVRLHAIDGVHLNNYGNALLAFSILKTLGDRF